MWHRPLFRRLSHAFEDLDAFVIQCIMASKIRLFTWKWVLWCNVHYFDKCHRNRHTVAHTHSFIASDFIFLLLSEPFRKFGQAVKHVFVLRVWSERYVLPNEECKYGCWKTTNMFFEKISLLRLQRSISWCVTDIRESFKAHLMQESSSLDPGNCMSSDWPFWILEISTAVSYHLVK